MLLLLDDCRRLIPHFMCIALVWITGQIIDRARDRRDVESMIENHVATEKT